jgi:hypothetical protein
MEVMAMKPFLPLSTGALLAVVIFGAAASAQTAPQPAESSVPVANAAPASLEPLAWLRGCWQGKVNQREFLEQWLPLRGGMMAGISQTVIEDKTQDYEYLRLERRADGIYYVTAPSGQKETAFKLVGESDDKGDRIFTFANPVDEFPQRIVYRRGAEGWLYAHVEGKLAGQAKQVIYPMRRIDCQSGELIRN